MVRLHQKVNPARWYYHADRAGVLIFQDMVQHYGDPHGVAPSAALYMADLEAMIRDVRNHPSVVQFETFNEGDMVRSFANVSDIVKYVQGYAPGRLVDTDSGGPANNLHVGDVDDIHEFLLIKGIEAVSTHGGKDQEERDEAVMRFKRSDRADVLVATDVAAKGLDFPDVQQVINFDMPDEIENYVHRIGRTGRCGKTGVATTFINKTVEESVLLDLKHLLKEAKQRVPPVLGAIPDPDEELAAAIASPQATSI